MNYNEVKFLSKLMWLIYIVIGLAGITYVHKLEYKVPIVDEDEIIYNEDVFFEFLGYEDISTEKEKELNKHSYIFKVEIFDRLTNSMYQNIANNIIRDVQTDIKKIDKNINLNNIEVQFYIGKDMVHSYNDEK